MKFESHFYFFISRGIWIVYPVMSLSHTQEQLRKRKDEEERQEILSHSLRGSKKLQALESHATSLSGQENLAYAQDEVTTSAISRVTQATPNAVQEVEEPPRPLSKSFFFLKYVLVNPLKSRKTVNVIEKNWPVILSQR